METQYIYDKKTKKMKPNPKYLIERQENFKLGYEVVDNKRIYLADLFGIEGNMIFDTLSLSEIIGTSDMEGISKTSFDNLKKAYDSLIKEVSAGVTPKFSTIFYLGTHARLDSFAYSILSSAYLGGLKVAPLLTPIRLKNLINQRGFEQVYFKSEIVVMFLPAGYTIYDLSAVKGFLSQRSLYRKPTIVLLGSFSEEKQILLNLCTLEQPRYDLGVLLSVTYNKPLTSDDIISQYTQALNTTNTAYNVQFDVTDSRFGGLRQQKEPVETDDFMKAFTQLNSAENPEEN